jgi:hypothetical protein
MTWYATKKIQRRKIKPGTRYSLGRACLCYNTNPTHLAKRLCVRHTAGAAARVGGGGAGFLGGGEAGAALCGESGRGARAGGDAGGGVEGAAVGYTYAVAKERLGKLQALFSQK